MTITMTTTQWHHTGSRQKRAWPGRKRKSADMWLPSDSIGHTFDFTIPFRSYPITIMSRVTLTAHSHSRSRDCPLVISSRAVIGNYGGTLSSARMRPLRHRKIPTTRTTENTARHRVFTGIGPACFFFRCPVTVLPRLLDFFVQAALESRLHKYRASLFIFFCFIVNRSR